MVKKISAVVVMAALCSAAAHAQIFKPASCEQVWFATVGWSDIEATTAVSTYVLQTLGYKTEVLTLSVRETFAAPKAKKVDVFLGYWSPTQDSMVQPLQKDGSLKVLDRPNLANARYTLAVPEYLYEQGLKSFADIAKFKAELGGQIHGIEPGNDGNGLVQKMIKANQFNLGGFALVESSENGMVEALSTAVRAKKPIVFQGWEPHPMNLRSPIRYLSGGDDVFGPNFGALRSTPWWPAGWAHVVPICTRFLKTFVSPQTNKVGSCWALSSRAKNLLEKPGSRSTKRFSNLGFLAYEIKRGKMQKPQCAQLWLRPDNAPTEPLVPMGLNAVLGRT